MVESLNGAATQGDARAQRMQRLRRAIAEKGTLHLKDAARLLNISDMTVRRDLAAPDATLVCLGGFVVNAAAPTKRNTLRYSAPGPSARPAMYAAMMLTTTM